MPTQTTRIKSFDLQPGRLLAGKYRVEARLGSGWEGEVYKVVEVKTGIHRALKMFFPHRNLRDRAVTFYAKKLTRLRHCDIVIQYHHSETIRFRGVPMTCLVSEYVEGELLSRFVARQRGGRLHPFEALSLLYALASGLEQVHEAREYHGDLHDDNVLVRREGVFFRVKLVDLFYLGAPTAKHIRDDVVDVIRLLYDAVGGQARYASQPPEIKHICRGLRRDLIRRDFPTARHLREHLETFEWEP
ncbi:MAG: protein kinase domain-containing protein [Planctomycetota bacterium]|jgi:serine/threonine protein kinase